MSPRYVHPNDRVVMCSLCEDVPEQRLALQLEGGAVVDHCFCCSAKIVLPLYVQAMPFVVRRVCRHCLLEIASPTRCESEQPPERGQED